MKRLPALLWLVVLLAAALYLGARLHAGLTWRTDLMALLPRDAQDNGRQGAEDAVTRVLSQRLVLLLGNRSEAAAQTAARTMLDRLANSGIAQVETTIPGPEAMRRLGALYTPFRRGLLSEADREALLRGEGQVAADRALSQVFGFIGLSDAKLLQLDPFLLLPRFLTALPLPFAKVVPVYGIPMRQDGNMHWALVMARLTADPYALDVQRRLQAALDRGGLPQETQMLRLGAVFFAHAGAETALNESTWIGLASTLGTVLLILLAYRALAPLWLSLLVIAAGILAGLVTSLLIFGELHVATLLFGVSLIGVSVDYSIQYCTEIFAGHPDPQTRLRRVRAGIGLGTATTVIGYLTLLLAPFPGLYQIATFSAAGLVAAWLTVMLWLPPLDRSSIPKHGDWMLRRITPLLNIWQSPGRRAIVFAVAAVTAAIGLTRLHPDDDVRHMQSLSGPLLAEQTEVRRLIGSTGEGPFLLIRASDDETALQTEETVADRLAGLRRDGALTGWLAPAVYVPSAVRQRENRALVAKGLDPLLQAQLNQLGLDAGSKQPGDSGPVLTLSAALAAGAPLESLVVEPGLHLMLLQGLTQPNAIASVVEKVTGVTYVDPAGRFSVLLGKYRVRAIGLLAVSAMLMAPLLAWRYGLRGGLRVMLPPILAVALAPSLRTLGGAEFSFFDAMALVLVLSIGMDYAIFCAETRGARGPVTMLAVTLAAGTALLSFGLLALSNVAAVHAFGTTMTLGILLAFVLAPMAREPSA